MTELPNTKLIPLTQGKFAIVDEEDFERVNNLKWCFVKDGYAVRQIHIGWNGNKRTRKTIRMHAFVLRFDTTRSLAVDHINRNKLDNRKCNLRLCTTSQNQANKKMTGIYSSKYKGVYWNKLERVWKVNIKVNNKSIYIGRYVSEIEAALAYNDGAKKYFGEFALLNYVQE